MIYCVQSCIDFFQSTVADRSVVFVPVPRRVPVGNVEDVEEDCSPRGSWEAKGERGNRGGGVVPL